MALEATELERIASHRAIRWKKKKKKATCSESVKDSKQSLPEEDTGKERGHCIWAWAKSCFGRWGAVHFDKGC